MAEWRSQVAGYIPEHINRETDEEYLSILIRALALTDNNTTRVAIIDALSRFEQEPGMLEAIFQAIIEGSPAVFDATEGLFITYALENHAELLKNPQLRESFLYSATNSSSYNRSNACLALAMQERTPDVIETIKNATVDFNEYVRINALRSLEQIGLPEEIIPVAINALDDDVLDVQFEAVRILNNLGPQASEALPKLREMLITDDESLKAAVEQAIENIEG